MNILKKLTRVTWIFTIYFNFKYLPFKQAIKLPIFLYKPTLVRCRGSICIENCTISTGMIRLGEHGVSLFANNGIIWENHGGVVLFKGKCTIGSNSAISVGAKAQVVFGENFMATSGLKLASYKKVEFSSDVLFAWDILVLDSSFHKLKNIDGSEVGIPTAPVFIGKNNWITTKCIVLPGTITPDFCVVGAGSILNKNYSQIPKYSLISGNPISIKKTGIYIDMTDHKII